MRKHLTKIMTKNQINKNLYAVYRSYTTTKTNIQELDDPITT